ncbi:hypothetical protein E2Q21_22715 [Salmonella enterica subsp. enterica serovar Java]|uniref:Uncharacterized protein n=2 Tax=Salmonella enterica TaxID=28901 RepID=A0A603X825_SALER|nr:hypothetical protein [Salmonella enterica subsp. enterica serovar Java]EAN9729034.1 hypothetical protein [Salmonella enterica]EBV8394105.1 hypothetical protein [Salmonella enterica subsp. enterica serovar Virchow]EDQ0183187.1 hypothetical protein [Salmonella enterica subsp. enterica serovar 4,[5],12:b:-]EDV9616781.1 hypothetical protein [Salmonella enterica subsp. enterica serovar Paratyphi B]EEE5610059.1 hypothetical protein [Salmonella enterica subsp. enterica serovar Typhimurium]
MKNVKILAVAAALSAVMTGSAFAVPQYQSSGQVLSIATTFNTSAASYAEVVSKHVDVLDGNVSSNTVLAQVTNLPANSIIYDKLGDEGQLKFSDGNGHSFQAIAYKSGEKAKVVSAGNALPTSPNNYVTQPGDVIDISPVSNLTSAIAGVYTSTPTVYTWVE